MKIKDDLEDSEIVIDWDRIKELIDALSPIQRLTEVLQKEQLIAGHMTGALFTCNHRLDLAIKKGNTHAQLMKECLAKRTKSIMETIQFETALFFDPRYVHEARNVFTHQELTKIIVSITFLGCCLSNN